MINISSIKTHMYCPMKLYIQNHVDLNKNSDFQLAIEIKKLKIDILDLIQKNMRKIKKDMGMSQIEHTLSQNIDSYIKSTADAIISMDLGIDNTYLVHTEADYQKIYRENAIKKQMDYLQKELDEMHPEEISDIRGLEIKLNESEMNETARKEAVKLLRRLKQEGQASQESGMLLDYLDFLIGLPWKKQKFRKISLVPKNVPCYNNQWVRTNVSREK